MKYISRWSINNETRKYLGYSLYVRLMPGSCVGNFGCVEVKKECHQKILVTWNVSIGIRPAACYLGLCVDCQSLYIYLILRDQELRKYGFPVQKVLAVILQSKPVLFSVSTHLLLAVFSYNNSNEGFILRLKMRNCKLRGSDQCTTVTTCMTRILCHLAGHLTNTSIVLSVPEHLNNCQRPL